MQYQRTVEPNPDGSIEEKALHRLVANRRSGFDPYYKFEYDYSIPSWGRYHWQWLWDSCFHIIALARLDPNMAVSVL